MSLEIIIGLIGLVIAIATYVDSKKPQVVKLSEPIEEMDALRVSFLVNQKMSISLLDLLKDFIIRNKCADKIFLENLTYSNYLDLLIKNHEENLSVDVYNKTLHHKIYTRPIIYNMSISLQEQSRNLIRIKDHIIFLG